MPRIRREGVISKLPASYTPLKTMTLNSTELSNGERFDNEENAFNLQTCARPNILALKPYRCAREYSSLAQTSDSIVTTPRESSLTRTKMLTVQVFLPRSMPLQTQFYL